MNEFCDSFGIYKLAVTGTPASFGPSQVSLLTRWNAIGTGSTQAGVLANKGNRGNPALYLPFGASIAKTFSRQTTYTVGFRLNMGCAAGVGNDTVSLIDLGNIANGGAQILASLLVKADGSVLVFGNGLTGTPIFTTPVAVAANTDCYLEFSATISGTTNMNVAAEVRVNGVTVGAGNANIGRNANTLALGAASFKFLYLNSGIATPGQAYISDFYINNGAGATNTGFLAGTVAPYEQVGFLLPSADGSQLDWTPLSGSVHYTEINEIPQDGDASYVSAGTPGHIDTYHWQAIPTFAGTIPTVQMSFCASSDQEGTRTFQGNIGPGGGQQQTPEFGLCSGNFYRSGSFDLDPTTGKPWTQAAFNSRQFGIGLVR
jgi:hypothetical protein